MEINSLAHIRQTQQEIFTMNKIQNLENQISQARKEIKTDNMSMSIGEVLSLYRDSDLNLQPEYQRLYRWEDTQKTKFLESILLGIPLPPIFVAQDETGVWNVVDGLQRLSTILEITGELKNLDNTSIAPPLTFTSCKKIPALEGLTWNDLPPDTKRIIRRSRLNFNIILTENSIYAQYELFQRLNTSGERLSAQEVRNCLIIMLDNEFYQKLTELQNIPSFIQTTMQTENQISTAEPTELVIRYLINKCNNVQASDYPHNAIFSDFIDSETTKLIANIKSQKLNLNNEMDIFQRTFNLLASLDEGDSVFKKYYPNESRFKGAFVISNFEAITSGVALHIDYWEKEPEELLNKIKKMHSDACYQSYTKRGTRAFKRAINMIQFSPVFFLP